MSTSIVQLCHDRDEAGGTFKLLPIRNVLKSASQAEKRDTHSAPSLTANTLAYGILFLTVNRNVQDWIAEELSEILTSEDPSQWAYDQVLPKLKWCQAIMLEPLRLFSTITEIPKDTEQTAQTLRLSNRILEIPPHTAVLSSLLATHGRPKYWDNDSCLWRPSRWIVTSGLAFDDAGTELKTTERLASEALIQPEKGIYFPWAEGARYCPGKKFSLAEFVAIIARILRSYIVSPLHEGNEDEDSANKRILGLIDDSCQGLLIHIREPEKAALMVERRTCDILE
ncbi:MAG: hypothetical protein M1822_008546 [Bathelium mastoideum]|nr:MAG: hypothetical protein M1822_008546 [Bathelium mastoideum]